MPTVKHDDLIVTPFTVLRDGREKHPWAFEGMVADADQGNRPIFVQLAWSHLKTGDYSLEGLADRVAIERKSAEDLYGTIGQNRERFERELQRLDCHRVAAVVVEAEWSELISNPPKWSRLKPKTVYRSIISWQQKFARVHWWMMPGRRRAEITCFRLLERAWLNLTDRLWCEQCNRLVEPCMELKQRKSGAAIRTKCSVCMKSLGGLPATAERVARLKPVG